MCNLAHVIRYTVLLSEKNHFALLERWLICDCETECSFVYLIPDVYSGGTVVTVFGRHLDSVAEPRIILTVIVTRLDDDTNLPSYENETDSGVTEHLCHQSP